MHRIELINGLLVKKMGKKPPHVLACEALRDELSRLIPPGWRLTSQALVRIPNFDEPSLTWRSFGEAAMTIRIATPGRLMSEF